MKKSLKTWRLINTRELATIQHILNQALESWNEQYALFALSCKVATWEKPVIAETSRVFINEEGKTLAMACSADWSALRYCLFGEECDDFDPVCEQLLLKLFMHITGSQALTRHINDHNEAQLAEEWFYKGSPALAARFYCGEKYFCICLHPQWVLSMLPRQPVLHKPLSDLKQALASQYLPCQIELLPLTLPLQSVMRLQVGDVIKSDHALLAPLLLKHNQHTLCTVNPGTKLPHKSIQITRAS